MSYLISANKDLIDIAFVQDYLCNTSYWAKGISKQQVQKAIKNSLCFGVYADFQQIGFARVVTDYVRMAYLADVFIVEKYQKKGLGKKLIKTILQHEELQEVARWILLTKDAHGLYEQAGFTGPKFPEMYMERIVGLLVD